jgi:hypothetical protein
VTLGERLSTAAEIVAGNSSPSVAERALLLVYNPEEEAAYRSAEEAFLVGLEARGVPHAVVDLRTMPFEVLGRKGLLDQAPGLDATQPGRFRRDLAGRLEKELVGSLEEAARALGSGLLIVRNTASVFPWVSFANVLRHLSTDVGAWILVPFPGTGTASALHFMGRRDGFDYMARRV